MRSSYLIFLAGFCLVFAASACSSDDGGGSAGTGGTAGDGGAGGDAGGGGAGGAEMGPLTGEFRAYNVLVPDLAGCDTPDLSTIAGSTIGPIPPPDIRTKCIRVMTPDISGSMTFTSAGANTWDVEGTQDLVFALQIPLGPALASITTMSSTAFSGTGTGSVADGGSLTLDMLAAPNDTFNVTATVTGTVNCLALNNDGVGDACTTPADCPQTAAGPPAVEQTCTDSTCDPVDVSAALCPVANLEAGNNDLPLPDDPGFRLFPALNFTQDGADLDMEMGGGPDVATGWYIVDPANGVQFAYLEGPVTVDGGAGGGN